MSAQHARSSKKVHDRVRDPFLDTLHIQNRLAVGDQCTIYRNIETPDQPAKLIGEPTELGAVHRDLGKSYSRTQPMLASCPRFRKASLARRFHHRVVNFLELHTRSAHSHE